MMTNEQLAVLLEKYRAELHGILYRLEDCTCTEDGSAFVAEIEGLINQISHDILVLRKEVRTPKTFAEIVRGK